MEEEKCLFYWTYMTLAFVFGFGFGARSFGDGGGPTWVYHGWLVVLYCTNFV